MINSQSPPLPCLPSLSIAADSVLPNVPLSDFSNTQGPVVEKNLPSNLLDDLTDESGALAQVALGSGDTGLDDAGGGFLLKSQKHAKGQRPSSAEAASWVRFRSRDPPRGETVTRTWPRFRPTVRPDRAGASLAIVAGGLVDSFVGEENVEKKGKREKKRSRASRHEILWWRGPATPGERKKKSDCGSRA